MASSEEKIRMVRAVEEFIAAFADIVRCGEEVFPSPSGLGTDGSCWTDKEHFDYIEATCRTVLALLKDSELGNGPLDTISEQRAEIEKLVALVRMYEEFGQHVRGVGELCELCQEEVQHKPDCPRAAFEKAHPQPNRC